MTDATEPTTLDPIEGQLPVNILLVDDEVRNLEVLEAILDAPDYRLIRAATVEQALMLLLDGDFAVIVLDVQMPGMSGIELAGLIKQRKRTQHIPIIFLTAYFQEDKDVLEGYGSGGVDYLTKPINPQILKSKIAVFVDLFRKTRALAATNRALEQEIAQRQHAEQALREANDELESRVHARTADLIRVNRELLARERALSASEARVQRELEHQKRIEAALRASEAQLRLVTDHAPVYLAQYDRRYRLTFANRPYAERFCSGARELIGKHASDVMGEDAYRIMEVHFDAALEGRRVEFEIELPYAGRAPRWVYAIHEPERSSSGEIIGLVAAITDITDRKLAEQEMALARDRALAASRAKDDFLARLSHELRTPLNPVLLLASDAANNPLLPPTVRSDFEMIATNVTLEARLIDDLLDLTRIARGKVSLESRSTDVHEVVRAAAAMVQPDGTRKGLTIELRLSAENALVWGDDVRLKQVFWNVLQNAVKFTPVGGSVRVETGVDPDRAVLSIQISDTGIGMTQSELQRVFDAFEQGDHARNNSHRFGGLGLGLAISRMLVELHNGVISATSPGPGAGTTFTIELPLLTTPAEHVIVATPPTPQACSLPLPLSPREAPATRILLVEDHTPTRLALANLLIRRLCEVVTAGDATAARVLASGGEFDLLISDIGLPDGNGCDLMGELRQRFGLKGIALTGYGSQDDINRSEAAGFVTHLTKPVSMQALDAALAMALASRREASPTAPLP
jgi:PAS domain S-box-containing protein